MDQVCGNRFCHDVIMNSLMLLFVMLLSEQWWRHQMETFSALLAICVGNSPVPVNSPHKGLWRGALMFSLICVWINGWVNNREAGDLRHYPAHYDVIVMKAGLWPIETLRTNFSEILSEIFSFSFKKMHLKKSSAKWRPLCFSLNVLKSVEVSKSYLPNDVWTALPCLYLFIVFGLKVFITYIHVRRNWWNSMNWWSGHIAFQQTVDLPVIWDAMELMWAHYNGMNSKNDIY